MFLKPTIFVAMLAGAAGVMAASSYAVGNVIPEENTDPEAICRKLGNPVVPAADRPTRTQAAALKGCDSEKLYYGIGVKVDPVRARHCAILEVNAGDNNFAGGSLILMQVYANGLAVRRDLKLATQFSCKAWGAPVEQDLRMQAFERLKTKPEKFDACDYITSGMWQVCVPDGSQGSPMSAVTAELRRS